MGDNKISDAVRQLAYETGMWYSQNEKCQPGVPFYAFTQGELDRFVEKLSHLQGEAVPVAYIVPSARVCHDGSMEDGPDSLCFADEADDYVKRVGAPLFAHPQPAELSEVSGNSGELPPEEVTLKQVIDGYVATYGSLRQAAELLCIDPAYLSRLAGCRKTNPSDEVLGKLGLERRVVYTRKVHDYQPTKLHQRTKCA